MTQLSPIQKSFLILNVVFGFAIIVLIIAPKTNGTEQGIIERDNSGLYTFTNPILDYENINMEQISIMSENASGEVESLRQKYGLDFASVYFRDLNNGQWLGVNEKEPFASASLVKLPVFISFLKQAEDDPSINNKVVQVLASDVSRYADQFIKPKDLLVAGQSYTLHDLAERMIKESDNAAMVILLRNIDPKYRNEVFKAIGVSFEPSNDDLMIRVKDYAAFFRVLFNSSYLSRTSSEYALKILSETNFVQGLVAGVPSTISVAHKFGERSNYIGGLPVSRQLHDCGIIYYPNKPYILCVLTRGSDYTAQESFVRDISTFFYQEVDKSS